MLEGTDSHGRPYAITLTRNIDKPVAVEIRIGGETLFDGPWTEARQRPRVTELLARDAELSQLVQLVDAVEKVRGALFDVHS